MQLASARELFQARLGELLELFAIHDSDIGYCQGINELAAPFVHYFPDDAEAFWAFEALMRRLGRRNFRTDGAGMAAQLSSLEALLKHVDPELHAHLAAIDAHNCFFVFRSLLVLLRRDCPFDAVRVLSACPLGLPVHLQMSALAFRSETGTDETALKAEPSAPAADFQNGRETAIRFSSLVFIPSLQRSYPLGIDSPVCTAVPPAAHSPRRPPLPPASQAMTVWDVLLAEADPNFILYVLGAVVVRSRTQLLECGTMDQAFEAMATALWSPPSARGERWRAVDVWRLIHHARALHDLVQEV